MKTIANIFKILLAGVFLLLLSSCKRKKDATNDLSSWLDKHYPNRFEVLATDYDDIIKNLGFQVKNSVVAEKSNPSVQAMVYWNSKKKDLGLEKSVIDSTFVVAHNDVKAAQELSQQVKAVGLTETSVFVKSGDVFVLIFAEPTPEHRRQSLEKLEKVFVPQADKKHLLRKIYYIEPDQFGKNFGDLVPLVFWRNEFNTFLPHIILMLFDEQDKPFVASEKAHKWYLNTASKRLSPLVTQAHAKVSMWAKDHIKQPYTIMERPYFDQDKPTNMVIKLKFGYVKKHIDSTAYVEINHYLTVDCDVEHQTLGEVKSVSEQVP